MGNQKNRRSLKKAGIDVKAAGKARMLRKQKTRVLAFVEKPEKNLVEV